MQKRKRKIILSLCLFLLAFLFPFPKVLRNLLFFLSYGIVGYDILYKAGRNIIKGHVFDENFLMSLATIGAFFIGSFEESVMVMLLYQVGELFQSYAVDRSRKEVLRLMDIRPDYAHVLREEKEITVDPDTVKVGEVILVKPGEKIPLDGIVVEGSSLIDTKALTGEAIPKEVSKGKEVLSGTINQEGVLKLRVTKEFEESTVSKILELVENASDRKSKSENFITKFAKYYTPIVVIISLFLAVLPPLLIKDAYLSDWLYRALSFLVVSCPCALVISIPLSFFSGIGALSKIGVLVKGSNYIEAFAKTNMILFDKTGTLTEGVFEVEKIKAIGYSKEELLRYATYAESFSNHPISLSLRRCYQKKIDEKKVMKTKEKPGYGVSCTVFQREVCVGNEKWMQKNNVEYKKEKEIGTVLYVAIDKVFAGSIVISDRVKKNAKNDLLHLKKQGIFLAMLTGDREEVAEAVAKTLSIDTVYSNLLPQEKMEKLEALMKEKGPKGSLVFVGDGVNDAPVLTRADVGVAMGGVGSDAAIEAADIVIMEDELLKLHKALMISKKTLTIVKENIIFALTIKLIVLLLSAFGLSTMWEAVFADVGVSVLAILNALRILKIKDK